MVEGHLASRAAIPDGKVTRVLLGEAELEIHWELPDLADTREVKVSRLRWLGVLAQDLDFAQSALIWGGGGLLIFLGRGLAANFVGYETNGPSRAIFDGLIVYFFFLALCVLFSALSKLTRHEYRFRAIYQILLAVILALIASELVTWPLDGLIADSGVQSVMSHLLDGVCLGAGLVFLLCEIFPALRKGPAVVLAALLLLATFVYQPIHRLVSHNYAANADPVPRIVYPFSLMGGKAETKEVIDSLERVKPDLDRQRTELLKLR
jgi:hypothetical protein